jgi:hypothetical protein
MFSLGAELYPHGYLVNPPKPEYVLLLRLFLIYTFKNAISLEELNAVLHGNYAEYR